MNNIMLKIDSVSKKYKLGQIGGTTLRDELQRKRAKLWRKEDPTKKIGQKEYKYGEEFLALDNISFSVTKGEKIGIIGHNGAGKSTLLKLISRITAPTSGTISLNGRVASMLEVGTGFHPELSGKENIYMNGAILGMTKKEIDAKIEKIIDFSECRDFIDTPVKRYSSGMYVKLAFSVAAHLDSEILIMDEVLAVGDMAFQKKCLDKMNEVSKQDGRTILYVSHNMDTIRKLCDRVIVLNHGTIEYDGNVENGISIYLDERNKNNKVFYNFVDSNRLSIERNKKILINNLQIINKENAVYNRDEKLCFSIGLSSFDKIDNIKLCIKIVSSSGQPIGMTQTLNSILSSNAFSEYKLSFSVDISNLFPGKYGFQLCIFKLDKNNNMHIFDMPTEKIIFEVFDNSSNMFSLFKWNPDFGNVELNPVELLQLNK